MKFENLKLEEPVLKGIKQVGFEKATPIQASSIPVILSGKDVVAQSLTGSGKTAAFCIPTIQNIQQKNQIQAVIVVPVRELARQVEDRMKKLSIYKGLNITSVYGGVGYEPQIKALKKADVVVATPGRFLDHVRQKKIDLSNVEVLIVDEADKMFDMGFIDDLEKIIKAMPRKKQILLFSATMPTQVRKLVDKYLRNPEHIDEKKHVDRSKLTQEYYNVRKFEKFSLLLHLLKHETPGLSIVFCNTRREVDIVVGNLKRYDIKAMGIHGGRSQHQRNLTLKKLKNEHIDVLVATEVAARGIDIDDITHVYNYDTAQTAKEYTHRIGRTARAGKQGTAVTLLAPRDHDNFRRVMQGDGIEIEQAEKPDFKQVKFNPSIGRKKKGRRKRR